MKTDPLGGPYSPQYTYPLPVDQRPENGHPEGTSERAARFTTAGLLL